ncbi:NAD(P)H-dependent oxidoreductase [Sinorhizobium medicae]|uniref:NAD(P)H dehydrogenase (Quinone) n=2 Tax=Sinorhizobium medicae TaxID=110321 RepID=A6UF87_SINMW|nr:NAD(P)H-dependent oxidoreductase [Sinorhizobium medicae]ABR62317.1 NAD(P)H dehydrogenase (quinone) [Sinorhizobium medicae WSM419]MBO1940805.1 NAD(P)H-dependent oxidoreductase [Sinorhizobium medicae]MBO1964049.1 NAD(P)H-dependent oxidoreductase [Sinorhizobium medicae]MDX0405800.1 flavodoxin family protein [Sinorhizobium medicae]MDX0411361.1 flavodoxin family protein [Sinorhizobium medicae]
MRILLVLAHPLENSFAASVARTAKESLEAKGHTVDLLDLYRDGFDPRLTVAERGSYFDERYDSSEVSVWVDRLKAADGLMLVFPQWWFNFPAILKGFFDRVFAPGVAFDHDRAGGRIMPRLGNIKLFWALTSTGSPWWVVHLYMGNPVRRLLKRGIAAFCGKGLDFRMIALHDMDRVTEAKRKRHLERVRALVSRI